MCVCVCVCMQVSIYVFMYVCTQHLQYMWVWNVDIILATDGAAPGEDEHDSDQQPNKEEPEVEPALVKSPPEPTRVKSPEQILMRSPEPVNWTVPLDTGKTFTVTQNVHEGKVYLVKKYLNVVNKMSCCRCV